jgi:signal transduction histidine kinase
MNLPSTPRVRRAIGVVFVGWAVFALLASASIFFERGQRLFHPFMDAQIGSHSVITQLAPTAQGSRAEFGDSVLAVNGVPYGEVLRRGTDWLRRGVPNAYTLSKPDGSRVVVRLAPEPLRWALTPRATLLHALLLAVALVYLITGGTAWWFKPERTEAWALLVFCCTMAVQLSMTMFSEFIAWGWQRAAINAPLIGASIFYLLTSYPVEPDWVVRYRRLQLAPYAVACGLVALSMAGSRFGLPSGMALWISYCFTLAMIIVSLGIVAAERRHQGEGPLRDRVDLVFLATLVSFTPIFVQFVIEWLLMRPSPYQIALIWTCVFPVSMGYGIVRRQLFEIRVFAKSSAAYGAATLAITGVFALIITAADAGVARLDVSSPWFQLAFLFFAILAFNPLRNRVQAIVDRVFDRDYEAYRVAVREISQAMVSMLSLSEIADRILVALTDTMGVDRAMVMLVDEDAKRLRPVASRGEWWDEALALEIGAEHPIWRHLWMRREDLSRIDFDDEPDVDVREACRDIFDTLEVELLVPILFGVDLLGVIAVGRKLSGDRLGWDDRTLLRTLANQSAIAIENAKAFDQIAKLNETLEARVDERTAELRETQVQLTQAEKMKSLGQLVAGVAHELNNPIGFVHANLQLLDEYVSKLLEVERSGAEAEPIRDAIRKLLSRSREGTERVKKIVQDLRTFSRMDQAELQDADLHEEIERALTLMEPRFKSGIVVERHFGDLPKVRCYAGQLNQVFLNLLMNACDAMNGHGTIRIRTRRIEDGVRLEFSDVGPGIPPEVQRRIFDPFFTTKPVGVGTGLGLSLSHGIIERHGGRFTVDSEVGVGTTFAIDLPLVAPPPAE